MKNTVLLSFLTFFLTATAIVMACDPGDPNCYQYSSSGNIQGEQWQDQSHDFHTTPDPHGYYSYGEQSQGQCATGAGQGDYEGNIHIQESQYDNYQNQYDFPDGSGFSKHFGETFQEADSSASVSPSCDLSLSTSQEQKGESFTSYTGNSMHGENNAQTSTSASVQGADGSAYLHSWQSHGYYQERGSSWQGGIVETEGWINKNNPPQNP